MNRTLLASVAMLAVLLLGGCTIPAGTDASTDEAQGQLTVADVRARSIELAEQALALVPIDQQDPDAIELPEPGDVPVTLMRCPGKPGLYWYHGGGAVALVADADPHAVAAALLERLVEETGWPILRNYQGGKLDYVETPDGYLITAIGVRAKDTKPSLSAKSPRVSMSIVSPCVPAPDDDPNARKKY